MKLSLNIKELLFGPAETPKKVIDFLCQYDNHKSDYRSTKCRCPYLLPLFRRKVGRFAVRCFQRGINRYRSLFPTRKAVHF